MSEPNAPLGLTVAKRDDGFWHVDYVREENKFHCSRISLEEALVMAVLAVNETSGVKHPMPSVTEVVRHDSIFRKELESLLNRFSRENRSNTPDFILANYLESQLNLFDVAVSQREKWYGRSKL